jgi:hypothetical protein
MDCSLSRRSCYPAEDVFVIGENIESSEVVWRPGDSEQRLWTVFFRRRV